MGSASGLPMHEYNSHRCKNSQKHLWNGDSIWGKVYRKKLVRILGVRGNCRRLLQINISYDLHKKWAAPPAYPRMNVILTAMKTPNNTCGMGDLFRKYLVRLLSVRGGDSIRLLQINNFVWSP